MKKIYTLKKKRIDSIREFAKNVWEVLKLLTHSNLIVLIADLDKRSINQNKFYWLIVNKISEGAGAYENDIHLSLKCLFLYRDGEETKLKDFVEYSDYSKFGECPSQASKIPESKKLGRKDFPEYWKRCARFGNAMYELDLPENPNEMTEKQYIEYLKTTIRK